MEVRIGQVNTRQVRVRGERLHTDGYWTRVIMTIPSAFGWTYISMPIFEDDPVGQVVLLLTGLMSYR